MTLTDILIAAHLSGALTESQLGWISNHFDSLSLHDLDLLGELGELISQGLVNIMGG
jgi:hypothetical protein